MIKQAARILVDNAAQSTPEGGDILLRTGRNEKGHSFFLVQDEGIGISPDDTPHIFERFFRSDPARSREYAEHAVEKIAPYMDKDEQPVTADMAERIFYNSLTKNNRNK